MNKFLIFVVGCCISLYAADESGQHGESTRSTQERQSGEVSKEKWSEDKQQDKLTQVIQELFLVRQDNAKVHAQVLNDSLKVENEEKLAERAAGLINSLDDSQKRKALESISKILNDVQEEAPQLADILRRLKWGFEEKLTGHRSDSVVENKFKDRYEEADQKAVEKAKKFRSLVERANQGDKAALKELLDNYQRDELIDFIGSKVDSKEDGISSDLTKAMGWKDVQGNTYLDLNSKDKKPETWSLGKSSEEIRSSLRTFQKNQHGLENVSHGTPAPGDTRRFLRAEAGKVKEHSPKIVSPEDKEEICNPPNPAILKAVKTKRVPGYFFRPFPISNMGSYAASDHNYVLSLDNPEGSTEMIVPGSYDPVPTPDEQYMTIPSDNQSDPKKGITFFSMNKLLNGETEPLYVDTDFKGVYQSIGTRKTDPSAPVYRILTDYVVPKDQTGQDGLSIRDYKVTRQRGDDAKVEPLGKGPIRICSGMKFSLPMMSKDGKQFSALDLTDYKTKIFNILEDANGIPTGGCEVALDLGMSTGKVDFNFNNDEVTFHKFNYDPDEVKHGYNEVPSDDFVGNVYVYKRSTGVISRITNNTDSNAIYPAFRKDGKIVYINHPRRGEGYSGPSTLVIADPNQSPKFTFDFFPSSKDKSDKALTRMKNLSALGMLWNQLCSPFSAISTVESSVLSPLGLSEQTCSKMVDKYWNEIKPTFTKKEDPRLPGTDFSSLSQDEVKKACPKPKELAQVSGTTDNTGSDRPRAPIPSSCRHCHSFKWDDPDWLKSAVTESRANPGKPLIEEIIRRVSIEDVNDPDRMPARNGGVQYLTDTEKSNLLNYLNKLIRER